MKKIFLVSLIGLALVMGAGQAMAGISGSTGMITQIQQFPLEIVKGDIATVKARYYLGTGGFSIPGSELHVWKDNIIVHNVIGSLSGAVFTFEIDTSGNWAVAGESYVAGIAGTPDDWFQWDVENYPFKVVSEGDGNGGGVPPELIGDVDGLKDAVYGTETTAGILERLAAIEAALSKPGASGISRIQLP